MGRALVSRIGPSGWGACGCTDLMHYITYSVQNSVNFCVPFVAGEKAQSNLGIY